jgi:chromosome segregation ATPase
LAELRNVFKIFNSQQFEIGQQHQQTTPIAIIIIFIMSNRYTTTNKLPSALRKSGNKSVTSSSSSSSNKKKSNVSINNSIPIIDKTVIKQQANHSTPHIDMNPYPATQSLVNNAVNPIYDIFPSTESLLQSNSHNISLQSPGLTKLDNDKNEYKEETDRFWDNKSSPSTANNFTAENREAAILALQNDNRRLIRSNNSLYNHLIAENETAEDKLRAVSNDLATLKQQFDSVQFLNTQKSRKLQSAEGEISELRSKIEKLLSDKQYFVREALEAPYAIEANHNFMPNFAANNAKPLVNQADLPVLKASQDKIAELQAEIKQLRKINEQQSVAIDQYDAKILHREGEIDRLAKFIENDRNWDKLTAQSVISEKNKETEKLTQQLDYLNSQFQQQSVLLDRNGVNVGILSEIKQQKHQIEQLNEKISHEKQEVSVLNSALNEQRIKLKQAEADKAAIRQSLQEIINKQSAQIEYLTTQNSESNKTAQQLEIELNALKSTVSALKTNYNSSQHSSELVSQLNSERELLDVLKSKYNALVASNEALLLQHSALSQQHSALRNDSSVEIRELRLNYAQTSQRSEEIKQKLLQSVENNKEIGEKNVKLNGELEILVIANGKLENQLNFFKNQGNDSNREVSQLKATVSELNQDKITLQQQNNSFNLELNELKREKAAILADFNEQTSKIAILNSELAHKNEEIQRKASELTVLSKLQENQAELLHNQSNLNLEKKQYLRQLEQQRITIGQLTRDKEELFQRINGAVAEKNNLLGQIAEINKNNFTLNSNLQFSSEEAKNTENTLNNLNSELENQNSIIKQLKNQQTQLNQTIQVLKLENSELNLQLSAEKSHQNSHSDIIRARNDEIFALKQEKQIILSDLEGLQAKNYQQSEEIHKLGAVIKEKQQNLNQSEFRIQQFAVNLSNLTQSNENYKGQIEELKALIRNINNTTSDASNSIADITQQLQQAEKQIILLSNENNRLQSQLQHSQNDVSKFKQLISELDNDRNGIIEQNRAKTIEIEKLYNKENIIKQTQQQLQLILQQSQAQIETQTSQLNTKEETIGQLSEQNRQYNDAVVRLEETLKLKQIEMKNVLEDLNSLLKENQLLTNQLNSVKTNNSSAQVELERRLTHQQHLEEVNKIKERELEELLINYRAVCLELERYKLATAEVESERNNYKSVQRGQNDRIQTLEITLNALEQEKQRKFIDLNALEQSNQQLQQQIERERLINQQQKLTIEKLSVEIQAARNVSAGLQQRGAENNRINIEFQSQLSRNSAELHNKSGELSNLQQTNQLQAERIAQLENILNQLRLSSAQQAQQQQTQLEDKIKLITELNLHIQQTKNHAETLQEQLNLANQQRQQQAESIANLTHALQNNSNTNGQLQTLQGQLLTSQKNIEELISKCEQLNKEKVKLRNFMFKYEAEIQKLEEEKKQLNSKVSLQQQFNQSFNAAARMRDTNTSTTSHTIEERRFVSNNTSILASSISSLADTNRTMPHTSINNNPNAPNTAPR